MSKYIEYLDKEYNDGNITLGEVTKLREDYNKSSAYDKGNLEIKHGGKVKGGLKSIPKISNEEKVIDLLIEQNSKLSTIKSILQFYFFLTILSFFVYFVIFINI
mgnify:CR=1 FL=1